MITQIKVSVFMQYSGYYDLWLHTGTEKEHSLLDTKDWDFIESYIKEVRRLKTENTFEHDLEVYENSITAMFDNKEVMLTLRKIALNKSFQKPNLLEQIFSYFTGI
jgi:hypothetical protein